MSEKTGEPPILVVTMVKEFDESHLAAVRKDLEGQWQRIWNGSPPRPLPLLMLPPGCTFTYG